MLPCIESKEEGVEVPTPTLFVAPCAIRMFPDVCCTTNWLVPMVSPLVEKVLVALVFIWNPPLPAVMASSFRYMEPVPV